MSKRKISKFDEKYIKSHYITKFEIDDKNKKIKVSHIDGKSYLLPLTSGVLANIKSLMRSQYDEWRDLVKRIYILHPVKLLYLNTFFKKQKYYLEHESEFYNWNIKKELPSKKLSKKEVEDMKKEKEHTHSYFNLSSVGRYKLSTMKKMHKISLVQSNELRRKSK